MVDSRLGHCLTLNNGMSVPGNVPEVLVSFLGRGGKGKGWGFCL